MFQKILVLLLVGFSLSLARNIDSIFQIYDKLEQAVSSTNSSLCDRLLDKHYLTENRQDAIWTYAMKDSKELLDKNFPFEDYITMDKDIKNIKQLWNRCKDEIEGTKCHDIFHVLHYAMKDFRWKSQEWQVYYRINYFSIRIAFQSMVILMFSSMTKKPWVDKWWPTIEWMNNIHDEYDEMTKSMILFREKLQEERPWEIGEAQVCELKRYMWKEFVQPGCEKRWNKNKVAKIVRRSVDENDGDDDGDEGEEDSSGDQVSEEEKNFFGTFANPDRNTVNLIGGKSSEYEMILQSRFTDSGGRKVLVTGKREFSIREKSKGDIIEELIDLTVDERDKYVNEKIKELDDYMMKTYDKVQKSSGIFVKELRKKTEYWKGPVNNEEHQHKLWF